MSRKTCTITLHPDAMYVAAPFNEAFVTELKRIIYVRDRTWDEEHKTWSVAYAHQKTIEDLCKRHFERVFEKCGTVVTELHTGQRTEVMRLF